MAPVEVTLDNFEDLLAYDDVLLDYFNAFLSLPVFSQQLHYNRLTGTFEDLQETDAISRVSPFSDGPPRTPPAYGATDVERQRAMQWAANHRLPIFFKTQLFREYKLCRLLLKRLDSTRSKHAPRGSAGGYSRRTTSSCTSTTANSADNSAKDADLDDSYAACWSDGSAMFNKSYDGPGSRATSLPVYAGLCFSPTKKDENVRSGKSKPIDSPRRPMSSSARNIAGLNTEHDDFGFQTEHAVMETSQTNLASVADVEIPKLQLVSNSDSLDTDQTGRQMARDTFSSSCCNMVDDEAAIETMTDPEDPTNNDLGLTEEGILSLEGRLKMSLQEMTQAVIGSMECMEQFRQFLQPTSGRHLFNFWLDCEYYQDVVQDFDDENGATQRNRLFREIQDKYKLTLNAETLQQFMEAANHFGLSRSVFIQTQYNTLRRLRAYWIPRYILHKERIGELEPALRRQQLSDDDVLDEKRRESITSGLFPSLSVVKSVPVNPHRNQISRASSISSGNQTNIEIKSMHSGQGSERKSSEADSQRKNLRDRFIAALSVEKKAGQPFRHFLQKSGEFDLLCNLLFWEDVFDYSLTESRSADRLLRFTRAWDIYNRYLSPDALWNIGAPQNLTDKIYSKLTIHKDASKLQIFAETPNLAVDKLQDAWIGFLKHDLKEYLECQVDQSGEDFQLIDISNIHLSFDSSGQKLVRYFPPTPRDPGDASNGRTKQAADREGILERKRLMERERRKAIRAARIRQKEAKIRLKNALLQEQDMIASGLKADEDRLSALDAAEAVEKPTLDKSLKNKSIMNAYRKYLSEGNNPDLCNALALFFEVDTYFSLGAAATNKSKKDTLATLLNRLYLQPDSRKRVQLNNYLATQLQNEKDRKRPRSPVLKEIETFLRPIIETNFDKYVEQQMAKNAQMKSLQTQNSTLKTKTSTNRAEEFDAAASMEAVFGSLFSTTTQFDSNTSQLALHDSPSKYLRRRATMATQGALLPPVEEANDPAGPLFSVPSKLRRQFQSISDTRSLPPISMSMFESFELSPKKDRFTGYVDRLRSSYLNRSQTGDGTTDATSVQGSKQTVKGPSKLPPSRDDRAQFLAALTQASAGHLPLHMWLYYEYLVQCGEEEGNNRLDRDLFFYCEVFKFKEASHLFADEELLKRKVQSILDIYLEPATTKETAKEKDANTPLDITSEVHQKTIKAAQKYAAGRDVSSTIFDDAQASVFKELLPYWVGFMANYTPLRDGRPIPMTRQMRARRKKLEEVMSWKPPSAKSVSLPVRPEGSNVVSSFTFTIHDGFQWKENRTTDDTNSHAADKLSDLDESDELRRLRKASLASHSTGGATGSDSRIPRHGIPQVAPLAAI